MVVSFWILYWEYTGKLKDWLTWQGRILEMPFLSRETRSFSIGDVSSTLGMHIPRTHTHISLAGDVDASPKIYDFADLVNSLWRKDVSLRFNSIMIRTCFIMLSRWIYYFHTYKNLYMNCILEYWLIFILEKKREKKNIQIKHTYIFLSYTHSNTMSWLTAE
jgi:hypothetical protein